MALLNIQDPPQVKRFSLFVLGFRPFFLAAGIFSVLSMSLWMAMTVFGFTLPIQGLSPYQWHAHEMIYGFTLAVVCGFLLTAIKNWTGVQTLQYRPLILLFLLWLGARLCWLWGTALLPLAAFFDLGFNLLLFYGTLQPVVQVKQWKQLGIVSKILMLAVTNALFYLGALGYLNQGVHWGLIGGVMLLVALIMTMGRRVMPSFIQNAVSYPVQLKNSVLLDRSSLILFLLFALTEVFLQNIIISSYLATGLLVVSAIRLYNWHTPGIWQAPLLWGLYGAFLFITLGFLIFALLPYTSLFGRSAGIHAFTFGGIAMITISMMARVTLGHTGRDIKQHSALIGWAQGLVVAGAIIRVLLTALVPEYYLNWILISQLMWIAAFSLFVWVNLPFLIRPRVDGAAG